MKCNPVDYPLGLWIKLSFVFAFTTSLLLALGSFTGGFLDMSGIVQIGVAFTVILLFAITNICIHVYFRVEDPIKSPWHIKLISFSLGIILMYGIHCLEQVMGIEDPRRPNLTWDNPLRNIVFVAVQSCLVNAIVLLWLYFLMSEHNKTHHQLERSRLERSREEAVNMMLRQQVQPHFLFNALTTLKSLIKKDQHMAEKYLLKLSDFLRVSIASVKDRELATVEQETKLCRDYLDMQQMRFGSAMLYDIQIPTSVSAKLLPVFSLQPLVDNALKHNNFTESNPIHIAITEEDGWVVVKNSKNVNRHAVTSNGSGLQNIKERYAHMFLNGVEIEEDADFFAVRIKIVE